MLSHIDCELGEANQQLLESTHHLRTPQKTVCVIVLRKQGGILTKHTDVALQGTFVDGQTDPCPAPPTVCLSILQAEEGEEE